MDMQWFKTSIKRFEEDHGSLRDQKAYILAGSDELKDIVADTSFASSIVDTDYFGLFDGYKVCLSDVDEGTIVIKYVVDGNVISRELKVYEG